MPSLLEYLEDLAFGEGADREMRARLAEQERLMVEAIAANEGDEIVENGE